MQQKKVFLSLGLIAVVVFSTYFLVEVKTPQSHGTLVQEELEQREDQEEAEEVVDEKVEELAENTAEEEFKTENLSPENAGIKLASRSQSSSNQQQANERLQQEPVNKQVKTDFNAYVLDMIKTYDIKNVSYPYLLNNDYANYNGVTTNLVFQGQTLAKSHSSGNRASHCVGITFEIFFKSIQARNKALGKSEEDFNELNFNQLKDLMLTWYVANGSKSTSNVAVALERYGLGKRIYNLESARAGDFIDFDRSNGTGHSAVFLGWVRDDSNSIIGIKYWSSQESTNGINYKEEYFGNVLKDPFYIARVY